MRHARYQGKSAATFAEAMTVLGHPSDFRSTSRRGSYEVDIEADDAVIRIPHTRLRGWERQGLVRPAEEGESDTAVWRRWSVVTGEEK